VLLDDAVGADPLWHLSLGPLIKVGNLSLSYNLSCLEDDAECLKWLVEDMDSDSNTITVAHVKQILVSVTSEAQKKFLLEKMVGSALLPRITVSVRSKET